MPASISIGAFRSLMRHVLELGAWLDNRMSCGRDLTMLTSIDGGSSRVTLRRIYEHGQLSTVEHLYQTGCSHVPFESGVYFVLVPDLFDVNFSNNTTAIREYMGRSLLYPAEELASRFQNSDKRIMYIGKASGERNRLRQRLRQLVRYGYGEVQNHRGGRALWQIDNAHQLLIEYLPCEQATQAEADLLHEYVNRFNSLPIANWQLPQNPND